MNLMTRRDVWPRITALANAAQAGERLAAVAYVGSGASKMLPLSDGDVLVTDCTVASAAAGATDPHEVEKFLDAGVSVFRWEGLHAKVFVLGQVAVVGSANASAHSRDHLIEAAWVIKTKGGVREIRRFIESLQVAAVDRDWLDRCKKRWRPPRFRPKAPVDEGWSPLPEGTKWRCWCIQTAADQWPQYVEDAVGQHHKGVRTINSGPYRLESLTWESRPRFRKGDVVIERWTGDDGRVHAYAPAQVEEIWVVRRGQSNRRLVTLMRPPKLRPVSDARLVAAGAAAGLIVRDVDIQEIVAPKHRKALIDLWPDLIPVSK